MMGFLIIIFVLLTIVLSVLRSRLVYELSATSLLLCSTTKPGIVFYTIIFLPGTIIHELSHWIVAEILQVRTGTITIFPDLEDQHNGQQRLGSVATITTDPFRGFLIGIAPFFIGLLILIVLGRLLSTGISTGFLWWQLVLIIYGIVVMGNSILISASDRRTWPFILIFFSLITIILYRMRFSPSASIYLLSSNILHSLNLVLGVTAGLNLVMIGWSYSLRRLIEKITRRRIKWNSW